MSVSAQITGGELIVRCLAAEGVRFVFGLPCPEIEPALGRARAAKGPAVVCVRTDRDANRAVPAEMFHRFFEVYQGPLG